MRERWLLILLVAVAAGTTILLGAQLGGVRAERNALAAQKRTGESQVATLGAEVLALKTKVGELTSQSDTYRKNLEATIAMGNAYVDWITHVGPRRLAAATFDPLKRAESVTIRNEPNPLVRTSQTQVDRAADFLAYSMPLGPLPAPNPEQVLFQVEFGGIKDGVLIVTANITYFRGEGFLFPGIGMAFGPQMNAN